MEEKTRAAAMAAASEAFGATVEQMVGECRLQHVVFARYAYALLLGGTVGHVGIAKDLHKSRTMGGYYAARAAEELRLNRRFARVYAVAEWRFGELCRSVG